MSERDELHLAAILRALDAIASYVKGLDEDGFISNRLIIDAVAMNLVVVGESAKKLSEPLRTHVPAPWDKIVGMRHRLAHEYFGMSIDRLWRAASVSAPELRRMVVEWQGPR